MYFPSFFELSMERQTAAAAGLEWNNRDWLTKQKRFIHFLATHLTNVLFSLYGVCKWWRIHHRQKWAKKRSLLRRILQHNTTALTPYIHNIGWQKKRTIRTRLCTHISGRPKKWTVIAFKIIRGKEEEWGRYFWAPSTQDDEDEEENTAWYLLSRVGCKALI